MSTAPEHMNPRLAVAEEILSLMGRRRVSQTKLAEALTAMGVKMTQPMLSKRLDGKHAFDIDELLAIAAYFDVEVTALFIGLEQGRSSLPWITTECDDQLDLFAAA